MSGLLLNSECEFDRLQRWALKQGIIDQHTGPTETVNRIIMVTERMHSRIEDLGARLQRRQEDG